MASEIKVALEKFVNEFELENLTPEIELDGRMLVQKFVNRPALQLTGFFDHFDREPKKIEINEIYSIDEDAKETLQEKSKRMLVTEASQ